MTVALAVDPQARAWHWIAGDALRRQREGKGLLVFFALWQGAYAASLAPLLELRAERSHAG